MRLLAPLVVAVGLLAASPAAAQFRNMGAQINVGWLALGDSTDWINSSTSFINPWNIHDHVTIGAGYYFFVGYNLRFDSQLVVGGGTDVYGARPTPIFDVQASQGIRYLFFNERHRPFVSAHIQYLNLFVGGDRNSINGGSPTERLPGNDFLLGQPIWVGARVGGGYEWIFLEEQGVEIEAGLTGLVGFFKGDFIRPSAVCRVGWNIYF